jgi:hypothetical protein
MIANEIEHEIPDAAWPKRPVNRAKRKKKGESDFASFPYRRIPDNRGEFTISHG